MSNFEKTIEFITSNSPFGFIPQIDYLLRKINANLIVSNLDQYNKIIKIAEESEFRQIPYGENSAIVSPYNKDKDNNYYCSTKAEHFKFKINSLTENLSDLKPIDNDISIRKKISEAVEAYIEKYYPSLIIGGIINNLKKTDIFTSVINPLVALTRSEDCYIPQDSNKTAFYVHYNKLEGGNFDIFIIISSRHLNFSNNQTAFWNSLYKLNYTNKEYKLSGTVKIGNYYFEGDNNSHFDLEENLEEMKIKVGNEDKISSEVIKAIEDFENDLEKRIFDLFENFGTEVMKPLRRNVTVTGNKMNWDITKPSFSTLKD